MFLPLLVDTTTIGTIEVSALSSCFFDQLSCCLIEYIIYTTTESVASLTHSLTRIHNRRIIIQNIYICLMVYEKTSQNLWEVLYLCQLVVFFESLDTIIERWMSRKKWIWFVDHECCHFFVLWFCMDKLGHLLEFTESWYHLCLARVLCATEVCTILTHTWEPHHHEHREESEYELECHIDTLICDIWEAIFFSISREERWYCTGCDMREEYDECIHHTLKERESYHISVEYVCHLMSHNSLNLSLIHLIQKPCGYCHERTILGCTCCECIGFCGLIVSDLWHGYMICLRYTLNCVPYNLELTVLVCCCPIENYYTICTLRHPARDSEGDKRSSKTKNDSIYHDGSHAST